MSETPSTPSVTQPTPIAPFYGRDLEEAFDYMNGLIYGDFGVGKTYLAGSSLFVPEMRDILYIALEGGEKGLKEVARQCRAMGVNPNKHMMVVPVQNYKQYAQIYQMLQYHIQFRDANDVRQLRKLEGQIRQYPVDCLNDEKKMAELIPEPKRFRTVITDSLTEAQKYCMYQILGIDPMKQRLDQEPDSAQYAEWGKSREMIQFLVRRFRDMAVHSWFICGQDIDQDDKKKFHYFPLLPGKLADDVRGLVDIVGYYQKIPMEGGKVVRRLFLEGGMYGTAYIAAKHRFGTKLKGLWLDDPTMKVLYDLDNG